MPNVGIFDIVLWFLEGYIMKNMTDIIEKDAIAIMENVEHKAVIDKLLELLKNSNKITSHTKLRELILERENIISTGIGVGLAIPHTRRNIIKDFVASAVLIRGTGCEWNSIDNLPVNFAILIASPQDTHKEYLKILANSVLVWKNEDKRNKILSAKNEAEIYDALSAIEFDI